MDDRKIEYKVVTVSKWGWPPSTELEREVNALILQGWEPIGTASASSQSGGYGAQGQYLTQAMVRRPKN